MPPCEEVEKQTKPSLNVEFARPITLGLEIALKRIDQYAVTKGTDTKVKQKHSLDHRA
jgi:hypothetical protein